MDRSSELVRFAQLRALLIDLDGVVTQTARVHARAWKLLFDELRQERLSRGLGPFESFDIERDYTEHVNGKPRLDGVRAFLRARGLQLPEGTAQEPPGYGSVWALGHRKNELFLTLLRREGVHVYPDAVQRISAWRRAGLRIAVVTSSKNCDEVLRAANLVELFHERVDGHVAARMGLRGKPAPDTFLFASQRLGVQPALAAVLEDAPAGVAAGRAGRFGLTIGVDRQGIGPSLLAHGADWVVRSLDQLPCEVNR